MVWGVAALVHAVSDALASRFAACAIRGEISGFSRATSGHCYLSLKDADGGNALLRCAMFRRTAGMLDFSPADGQLVEVRGRLAVYEPRGELQFVIESMQRAGAGALFEQFLRLKARLEAEGLFDPQQKRELPPYPRRVGVVTSLGAAALHDVLAALARRVPHVEVIVYPSLVQGADAPAALVEAIGSAGRRSEVDVLIVCRGGGSLEDLWAFNDERVVRAIAACPLPVISGVGHETDITLADFAADLRATTPTAAAELVSLSQQECREMLHGFAALMTRRLHQVLDTQAQRIDRAALRLARPAERLRHHMHRLVLWQQRLDASLLRTQGRHAQRNVDLGRRLSRAAGVNMRSREQRLLALQARLESLDPRRVLSRGYAWLTDGEGRPVLSASGLSEGQTIEAVLADGQATARILNVKPSPQRD